jgi:hypothetical protein
MNPSTILTANATEYKSWTWRDKLRCKLFPPRYDEPQWPVPFDAVEGDGLVIRTYVHLSFLDRLRVLFSGKLHVCSKTSTEHVIGNHKTTSSAFPVWRFR